MNATYICPYCHAAHILSPGLQFCSNCRQSFSADAARAAGSQPRSGVGSAISSDYVWDAPRRGRPVGVILVALRFLFMALAGALSACRSIESVRGTVISFPLLACFALLPLMALAALVTAGGLIGMQAWARKLGIALIVLDMLIGVAAIAVAGGGSAAQWGGIVGAGVVGLIVIVYLLRSDISERFE